jgi:hypothetical protein
MQLVFEGPQRDEVGRNRGELDGHRALQRFSQGCALLGVGGSVDRSLVAALKRAQLADQAVNGRLRNRCPGGHHDLLPVAERGIR